ncbi:MAG: methionine--tRNA ligase subunit beta [Armatimonadetes bacterium]|nr:MAG: methionine--tRNA ligase subunit beta [Armatimonadota bacterium]
MITIDDFLKLELKVGTVIQVEDVPGSDKLLRLMVDLGEEIPRQILSGIKQWYKPEKLVGKQFIFIANLEPRQIMGMESQGMILCANGKKKPVCIKPVTRVSPGALIR